MKMVGEVPRRSRIDLLTPAERAIYEAIIEVEEVGAAPVLTEIVNMLAKARDMLADYVEQAGSQPEGKEHG